MGHRLAWQSGSLAVTGQQQSGIFLALQLAGSHGLGRLALQYMPPAKAALQSSQPPSAALLDDVTGQIFRTANGAKQLISTRLSEGEYVF